MKREPVQGTTMAEALGALVVVGGIVFVFVLALIATVLG